MVIYFVVSLCYINHRGHRAHEISRNNTKEEIVNVSINEVNFR